MSSDSKKLVWLITGTSSGLGRCLTLAALKRGDKVIATSRSRSFSKLKDLKAQGANILELDVTAPPETVEEVAKKAIQIYGQINVLVHNAGYGEIGPLEGKSSKEDYDQFNTHIFGPLNISRAFLPYMRERRKGTVVWRHPYYGFVLRYEACSLSQSLHEEISPFGLRSICFDAGSFRSNIAEGAHYDSPDARIDDYKKMAAAADASREGDPEKYAEVIVDVVRGEGCALGKPFPSSLPLVSDAHGDIEGVCKSMIEQLGKWKDVSYSTDFPKDA